ncbi:hypothetical protein Pan216_09530 [Planctomycetes bacterium Pan216]|uniref:DUF1800 domain-containing protein n=1 Tax=Kolteria novifilia TaxID=2527975 RepID=A0A518AZH5_9BACT|nr:hypothetical protein Pan216_09530 [Planctomycetes bacterium Pan216]
MTTADSVSLASLEVFQPGPKGWTLEEAAHLLRRAGFAARWQEITAAHRAGAAATIERLLAPEEPPAEFQETDELLHRVAIGTGEIQDLKAWWLHRMRYSNAALTEKMTLLWHNHFATSHAKVNSVRLMADQNALLRRHCLGDFRTLVHEISRDVAMLVWLDGNANKKRHPNENYARELMELFSLGEGNYSERDIQEAARAFSGWHVRENEFWFDRGHHDFGTKSVFGKRGNLDGDDIVDLCLEQEACPRFLATKLLDAFIGPHVGDVEVNLLAGRIRHHDFAMDKVVGELLRSELFFSPASRGAIIKSPVDFVIGTYRTLDVRPNLQKTSQLLAELGQDVFEPPTVKGWEGGRHWINTATILLRANFVADLLGGQRYGEVPAVVESVPTARRTSPKELIEHFASLLASRSLGEDSLERLNDYLVGAGAVDEQRSRKLLHLLMTSPEYQFG